MASWWSRLLNGQSLVARLQRPRRRMRRQGQRRYRPEITLLEERCLLAAPVFTSFAPSSNPLAEGSQLSLVGNFTDSDGDQSYQLILNWNDGTAPQSVDLGTTQQFSVDHVYA